MSSTPRMAPAAVETVYRERVWAAPWIFVALYAIAATAAVALYPAGGPTGSVAGLAASGAVMTALIWWWSPVVRVVRLHREGGMEIWLQAGPARIPARALGRPVPLCGHEWRRELGPSMDARSYRSVRGWTGCGVRIPVVDERDPVPYWLVSTRRPASLVAVLTS